MRDMGNDALLAVDAAMREEYPPSVQRAIDKALELQANEFLDAGAASRRAMRSGKPLRVISAPVQPSYVTVKAKGRIAKPRGMNKIEAAWGEHLKWNCDISWHAYEAITLKLADDTRYTPDWVVMRPNGDLIMYEVKGPHKREDAMVKLRVAARLFPMRFILVTRENDRWVEKEVTP